MSSAIVVSTRSVETATRPEATTEVSRDTINRTTAELRFARSFRELSATAITFGRP